MEEIIKIGRLDDTVAIITGGCSGSRPRGSIINISSIAADVAQGGLSLYLASKGAVLSMPRVVAGRLCRPEHLG